MHVADNLLDYYKLHKFTTPVFCSEEPWRQDGWCDDQGRCWYGNVAIKGSSHPVFSCSIWKLSSRHPEGVISLPHYALIGQKKMTDSTKALASFARTLKAIPLSEWHEEFGNVLWWKFPVDEPPYVGTPLDNNWPGYHTHFTFLQIPNDL